MIAQAHVLHPALSVRRLCTLFAVGRTGYYAHAAMLTGERDTALRAAIEEIVLAFPGYGYRRVTAALPCSTVPTGTPTPCAMISSPSSPSRWAIPMAC